MASKQHQKKKNTAKPLHRATAQKQETVRKQKSILFFLANVAVLTVFVCSVIYFTDKKGWFAPNSTNNHTQRKLDAFYRFTKKNRVDIVMVGNSHLYAGINPQSLSCMLGANCFILAAPGTYITDAYFCLKEAIAVCKPKIAVIETYAIKDYRTHDFTKSQLSDQIQSFNARRNLPQKLLSTPVLFTSDNYFAAWSNTVRNHSYILTDREQIRKNIKAKKAPKDMSLYLGRFVSDPNGMTDSTLRIYDGTGAVVDGGNYAAGDEAIYYVKKIITLCRENGIEPVFLTIPMYHRHVKDYDIWKSRLEDALSFCSPVWLDMQSPYDYDAFVPGCFENTVRSNQHLSYSGGLVCSSRLAHFIHDRFPELLPDRSMDAQWHEMFYGQDGYLENFTPRPGDTTATVLFQNIVLPNVTIKEIDRLRKKEYDHLLIKIDKQNTPDLRGKKLQLVVDAIYEGQQIVAGIEVETTPMYDPINHYLFVSSIRKDVDILGIRQVAVGAKSK
jgi:hypothetical protein